jgi:hypothetical protein
MVSTMLGLPLLVVGAPLTFIGVLAAIRPWARGRSWVFWVVLVGVVVWFLVILQGPSVFAWVFATVDPREYV